MDLDIEDFNILSNKELMYQVFENQISNAIKYSEKGQTISIVLKKQEGIFLSVSSKGSLTEEEIKKHILVILHEGQITSHWHNCYDISLLTTMI